MEISFVHERLRKRCESQSELVQAYGPQGARKVMGRLLDLQAAVSLEEARSLPGHCKELKGDRRGQLSLELDGGRRLIVEPADEPTPTRAGGGLDWARVTKIRIIDITDYHA